MKRISFILILLLAISLNAQIIGGGTVIKQVHKGEAPGKFKIFAGGSTNWVNMDTAEMKIGWHGGFSYVFGSKSLVKIEPGVRYITKGVSFDNDRPIEHEFQYIDPFLRFNFDIDALRLPIFTIRPFMGVSYALGVGTSKYYYDYISNYKESANINSDLTIPIGADLVFQNKYLIGLEYNMGFSRVMTKKWADDINNRSIILTTGMLF